MKVSFEPIAFKGYKFSKDDRGFRVLEFAYPYDPSVYDCYLEVFTLGKRDEFKDNYHVENKAYTQDGKDSVKLKPWGSKIDIANTFGITDDMPFGYHYILKRKSDGYSKVEIDSGLSIDERNGGYGSEIYNIVPSGQSLRTRGGSMKLVNIDAQHVGVVYNDLGNIVTDKKIEKNGFSGVKSLTNRYGGTLAGLEKAVDEGEYAPYSDILTLPVTAQKDVYWTENLFQIDQSIGNMNNYMSLWRKLFSKRINLVSDGAFVNEGLTGIHINHMYKWGEDSPYFRWFKAQSISDKPFSLGILPKNKKYVTYKLVNHPANLYQDNLGQIFVSANVKYDKTKPTYINFLDKRLTTDEERKDSTTIVNSYSKINSERFYDLTTHNDSVIPYPIEINPENIYRNIERINEYNRNNPGNMIKLGGYMAAKILSQSENFNIDEKFESGFETWDANPDIAKLSFVTSNTDLKVLKNLPPSKQREQEELIRRGNYQVQDYAVDAGKFWTRTVADTLRLHIARQLSDVKNLDRNNSASVYSSIISKADGKVFPMSLKGELTQNEVKNVLAGRYLSQRHFSNENKKSQILEGLMNTPLDSIELGNNLVSVLASPLISKRASVKDEIGKTRYELYRAGDLNLPSEYSQTYNKMTSIYEKEMLNFASSVLENINSQLPSDSKLFNGDNVTKFGQYVLPLILPQIAKYAIIKSFVPEAKVSVNKDNGEISYDYKKLKEVSLQTIGVLNPGSPEDEANMVLSKLKTGLTNLAKIGAFELSSSILKELKNTNANSFALADLIIDKTQSGLGWRIDATKDIADIEALRNAHEYFEETWQEVTDFWKAFSHGVLGENNNSYLVAEITMVDDLFQNHSEGSRSEKYKNHGDIMQKFFRETGITAEANYGDYFYNIAKMFSKSFENGSPSSLTSHDKISEEIYRILIGSNGMLKSVSLPSIMYTYSFVENHDKPRALHCAALDMGMFYADLNNNEGEIPRSFRKTAYRLLKDKFFEDVSEQEVDGYRFDAVSPKAIAMGLAIRKALIETLTKYRDEGKLSQNDFDNAFASISKAVSDLSGGYYKGHHFEPDSFGVKPIDANIDKVIEQAKDVHKLKLPKDIEKELANDAFESILEPALTKLLAMMKYLVALPGMPTMFDGSDYGTTGYESETKNMFLANRQKVHEEWVKELDGLGKNPRFKPLIAKYKKYFDDVMAVRNNPNCNALNNGAPFMLPVQGAKRDWEKYYDINVPAIFRQSPDGRMAISLFNTVSKTSHKQRFAFDHEVPYEPDKISLDSIKLNFVTKRTHDDKKNEDRYENIVMDGSLGIGLKGLKTGIKFHNALDPNDTYEVKKNDQGLYFLTRDNGGNITFEDTTLNLYYVPEDKKQFSFTGLYRALGTSELYKKVYEPENGTKLSLMK